ncbi:MAG TPA: fibronectin type III domain-containing protein, partial [Desulfobacteraceae bacterium]|nr:fibronectin type III domain-containing protein [Desulfobacteraceae bacterium]
MKKLIILSILLLSFTPFLAFAGSAVLNWQACADSDLAGYKVYYGTSSRSYGYPVYAGNACTYTIDNLAEGQTYYFAVTAVDTSGNECGYSAEVSKTIEIARAGSAVLNWQACTDSDLAGYKVYYGTSSRSYDNSVQAGNACTYTIDNLAEGQTYY